MFWDWWSLLAFCLKVSLIYRYVRSLLSSAEYFYSELIHHNGLSVTCILVWQRLIYNNGISFTLSASCRIWWGWLLFQNPWKWFLFFCTITHSLNVNLLLFTVTGSLKCFLVLIWQFLKNSCTVLFSHY